MTAAPPLAGERWVVICEEEVVPETTGCRVDHGGFLRACVAAGIAVEAVVPLPTGADTEGYAVAFPTVTWHWTARDESPLRQLSLLPYVVRSRPVPADVVTGLTAGGRPDAVVSYSVRSAELGRAVARELGLPHVVRCQNHDSAYFDSLRRGAGPVRSLAYRIEAAKLRRYETALEADPAISAFLDVSADEAAAHRQRTETPVLHVPSFALTLDQGDRDGQDGRSQGDPDGQDGRSGVTFVGSLDVETNQEAVRWLLADIWPRVRALQPTAILTLVGRRAPAWLVTAAAETAGVALHADVPAVAPYLRAAAVVVNPVLTGAGINVKLLQGMAAGAAAVSTGVGATGLDWEPGTHLLVADDADDFAAAVSGLLADEPRRAALARSGAAHVRKRLDPEAGVLAFAGALGRLPAAR